ncbi:DNA polymerase [Bienertia sinuspersici]
MSPKQVNELFEFPLKGKLVVIHLSLFVKEWVKRDLWQSNFGRKSRVEVFYPKGETGKVATNDFRMLWWFVHGDLGDF